MSRIATMSYPAHSKLVIRTRPVVPLALLALLSGTAIIGTVPIFVRLSELGPTATGFWRLGLAWVILQEPLGAWQAVGGAIVLAGICLAQHRSHSS